MFVGVLSATMVSAGTGDTTLRWVSYRDSSGVFSVQFPAAPKVKVNPNGKFYGKPAQEARLAYDDKDRGLLVLVYKLDNRWMIQGKEREFMNETLKGWDKGVFGKRIAGPTKFAWQGSPGGFLRFKSQKAETLMYSVLRGRHYVQLFAIGKPGALDMKSAQRFVNSFKFL